MSHASHPDVHTHGLADNCEACAEHAEKPFRSLDDRMIQDLATRTLSNRFGYGTAEVPVASEVASEATTRAFARSENEAVAMASLVNVLEQVGKLAEAAPKELEWYLRARWKIQCEIHGSERRHEVEALRERLEQGTM